MKTAMRRDFGWERSAERYAEVYRRAMDLAEQRS
jgi:starch synthase